MHPVGFQLKRAHLLTVAEGRRIFRGTRRPEDADFDGVPDMTPARFDILYLIYGGFERLWFKQRGGSLAMAALTRKLGLSRATISVATDRLVELGLITKRFFGGRGKDLSLTQEGVRRIRLAFDHVFRQGKLAHRFGHFFSRHAPPLGWRSWIDQEMLDAWKLLHFLAEHFGDTSEPVYIFRRGARWDPEL